MNIWRVYRLALLVAVAVVSSSASAVAADAKRGKTIATRWCAACHVVASDQTSASADAPSFADIAARRADAKALANFLVDPHPKMPDMHLTRSEIDDIVAYIRGLDPKRRPQELDGERRPERPKNG